MENLGIDFKLMIAQIVNFGLFFLIFKKFIAGPMNKLADDEKKKEEEKNKALQALQNCDAEIRKKEDEFQQKIQKEKEEFIKQAKIEAASVKTELVNEAKEEAKKLIEEAVHEIEERKAAFQKDIRDQVTDMSVLLLDKAFRDYLTDNMQKELTRHILNNLGKNRS